jgi:cell division protein FtsL
MTGLLIVLAVVGIALVYARHKVGPLETEESKLEQETEENKLEQETEENKLEEEIKET